MKVMITAGGTSEPIDGVRKITNMSTGRLGALIAATILNEIPKAEIFFLGTDSAINILNSFFHSLEDDCPNLTIVKITDTKSLEEEMYRLLKRTRINSVIHSMAVSDYRVEKVVDIEKIISDAENMTKEEIISMLKNPPSLDTSTKMSSSAEKVDIRLTKNPKLIDMVKEVSPDSQLIGFKLLNHVSEEELIKVARESLLRTRADYIVANDLAFIKAGNHKAFVVDKDTAESVEGKIAIAKEITNLVKESDYE